LGLEIYFKEEKVRDMKKQKKISSFDELPKSVQRAIREDAFQYGVTPELMFKFIATHTKEQVKNMSVREIMNTLDEAK